jgi:phytol kinase
MERMSLETKRNLFHLVTGICIVCLLHFRIIDLWIVLGGTVMGFLISMVHRKREVPVIGWFLRTFDRQEDIASIPGRGALFFAIGFLLVLALFPRDMALASITIFVLGDSISPLVGMHAGRIPHPLSEKKFVEGNIAGFLFAFAGAMLFVPIPEAFVASALSMAVEAVDTVKGRRIEDNVTIPLVAGLAMAAMRIIGL